MTPLTKPVRPLTRREAFASREAMVAYAWNHDYFERKSVETGTLSLIGTDYSFGREPDGAFASAWQTPEGRWILELTEP